MIKDIHKPFWTSLYTIPSPGKTVSKEKLHDLHLVFSLDENSIDDLAKDLEKTAKIQN